MFSNKMTFQLQKNVINDHVLFYQKKVIETGIGFLDNISILIITFTIQYMYKVCIIPEYFYSSKSGPPTIVMYVHALAHNISLNSNLYKIRFLLQKNINFCITVADKSSKAQRSKCIIYQKKASITKNLSVCLYKTRPRGTATHLKKITLLLE